MGAHDHTYRVLKLRLRQQTADWGEPISIAALAAELNVSRTPVREVLFRFIGEGVVEIGEQGGFRLFRPGLQELSELYVWQLQLVLTCLHLLSRKVIFETLNKLRGRTVHERLPPHSLSEQVFQWLGDATGNREFSRQMGIANDRLARARRSESILFTDLEEEAHRLVLTGDSDVKKITRRRVLAYFSRRIDRAKTIAENIWG